MTTKTRTLETLPDEQFGPIHRKRQSAFVAGVCEWCDADIAPNEVHLVRSWKNGPAEFAQHITCPKEA